MNSKYLKFNTRMPDCQTDPIQISKQMRLNADRIMKEISDHVDNEIERIRCKLKAIKEL